MGRKTEKVYVNCPDCGREMSAHALLCRECFRRAGAHGADIYYEAQLRGETPRNLDKFLRKTQREELNGQEKARDGNL